MYQTTCTYKTVEKVASTKAVSSLNNSSNFSLFFTVPLVVADSWVAMDWAQHQVTSAQKAVRCLGPVAGNVGVAEQ